MIKVSDINTYLKCPRASYFTHKGYDPADEISSVRIERLILKELALTYGDAVMSGDKRTFLVNELERISNHIHAIFRSELKNVDDASIAGSVNNIELLILKISQNLSLNSDFYSHKFIHEEILRSDKFGLSGNPDRLLIDDSPVPSIIKTGNMPDNGAWSNDRLQLTAYSILIEEKYDSIVETGFVEYARWGIVRPVVIKRHERRKVFQIRDKIRKIKDGFMPERPGHAPCEHCGFTDICEVRSTLASKFF